MRRERHLHRGLTRQTNHPVNPGPLSVAARTVEVMEPTSSSLPPVSASAANEAIREFVAGRTDWSKDALAELDRLRVEWRRAVRGEIVRAA